MMLKPGVRVAGAVPELVIVMMVVAEIYRKAYCDFVITSINDGKHSINSWHYKGRAFDCRTKNYTNSKAQLLADIKAALGSDFDVVLEDLGEANEHLHVEYDPKT